MRIQSPFEQKLAVILEAESPFDIAMAELQKLDEIEKGMKSAKSALRNMVDVMNGQLAGEIKAQNPQLTVILDPRGNVLVKYGRSPRALTFRPDVKARAWLVSNQTFDRQFAKYFGDTLAGTYSDIAQAVGKFFKSNYKALTGK